ncbi:MAG: NADH-quinone oxidoreductase subunit I [Candidatus Sericytochromatia bacterium]|nr:NADH-quinone oxidoreductase subunit I [Candidatus Sericytochromatia bacterium]
MSHNAPIDIVRLAQSQVNISPDLVPDGLDSPTQVVDRNVNQLGESVYLLEIAKGLGVTMGHVVKNLLGLKPARTVGYPEVKRAIPEGYRGKHRLTTRADGSTKCVACLMCATACPAECIHITPAESEDPDIERFPARFDIDLLECVFCGMCVEACPVDAIRMDSGVYSLTAFDRESFVVTKEELMQVQPDPHPEGQVY